jgi:hypothetical protein
MAPEQKTAADTVGPAADLYAVTAMLYELLLGVAPEGRWSAPSRERAELPAAIDTIIETGLSNRPRSRYQTADEYIKALDAIGVAAPPLPPPEPLVPPQPPQPHGPVQEAKSESWFHWLKTHSPGWILWNRLSKTQRYLLMGLTVVACAAILASNVNYSVWDDLLSLFGLSRSPEVDVSGPGGSGPDVSGRGGSTAPTANGSEIDVKTQTGKGQVVVPPPPRPTPPPRPVFIAGRWSDSPRGAVVNLGYVDIAQEGEAVTGVVYNVAGYQIGTLAGRVEGRTLQYDYLANNGMTGTARGDLSSDGLHLNLDIQNHQTGYREQHTLHKGHLPHQ